MQVNHHKTKLRLVRLKNQIAKKLADGISGNCKYINKNESVDKMAICANLRVLVIVSSIKKVPPIFSN